VLINELREAVKKYDNKELQKIIAELYKAIPKGVRESKDIDSLIQDVNSYFKSDNIEKRKDVGIDINELKPQIDLFIDFAYEQYYMTPNKFVAKKDRPKWRFMVKNFIKNLQLIPIMGDEGTMATDLLEKLFSMLSHGCRYYIFNTDNPFQSVGIVQTELLDIIIKRRFAYGIDANIIKSMIALVINTQVDRETVTTNLIHILISNLKTVDAKEMAIEQCKIFRKELNNPKVIPAKRTFENFWHMEKLNHVVELILLLNFELYQFDDGIQYFKTNYDAGEKEILLYVLLQFIGEYDLVDYWLREYDFALSEKIEPRERLKERREYIVKHGSVPSFYHSEEPF